MAPIFVGSTEVSMNLFIALQVGIKDFFPCSLPILKAILSECVLVCVCVSVSVTACKHSRAYLALMQSDKEVSLGNHSPLFLF